MKKSNNLNMIYKCPFVCCNAEFDKSDCIDEHLRTTEHNSNDFEQKCPVEDCENKKECYLHFNKRNAKLLRYLKYQENVIETSNSNFKELSIDILMKSSDTIATIINSFIQKGHIKTFDGKSKIYCRVLGCNKRYKAFPGYVYHIKNYKHPISEMVAEYSRINKIEIDDVKLKLELTDDKYVNGFILFGVKHFSTKHVFTEKSISFKNDFYNTDTRKDKFIYKKSTPKLDKSYIKRFKNDATENNVIHKIVYKGDKFDKKHGNLAFAMSYLNMSEFISCAYFDKQEKHILVSTRCSKEPQLLFKFESYNSRLTVLDLNLNIKNVITFNFGSVTKIRSIKDRCYYMLFRDGKVRIINLDRDEINEIIGSFYIDFEIIDENIIVCTDGFRVYKIESNSKITQSEHLPYAINCITVRKLQKTNKHKNYFIDKKKSTTSTHNITTDKLYVINEEKNSMLEEIRGKLAAYKIFCNTVEGNLYSFSDDLSDYIDILNIHSHKVEYLEEFDVFIVTDSINDKTKVLTIDDEFIKTHLLCDTLSYYNCTALGTIISSSFNGTVQQNWINYHKMKNINIVRFYRSGYDLLILDRIDEYELISTSLNYDYSTLAVYLFEDDHYLYTFLSSGVILKKLIKC